jgi:hypothetical protein
MRYNMIYITHTMIDYMEDIRQGFWVAGWV